MAENRCWFNEVWVQAVPRHYGLLFQISRNCLFASLNVHTGNKKLEAIFAHFAIPEVLFTDNGTQLTSEEMKNFAEQADFTIVTRSPAYPQANGQAKARVKIAKKILANEKPWIALLNYRSTRTSLSYNPSELPMKRKICTHISTFSHEINVSHTAVLNCHQTCRHWMEHQFNRTRGVAELPELKPLNSI